MRLIDIRFRFAGAESAKTCHRERLCHDSEGLPAAAGAPAADEECAVLGGEDSFTRQGRTVGLTGYSTYSGSAPPS